MGERNKIKIKKLGGENAAELSNSARNILKDFVAGDLQAVVVSAIRSPDFNTTDNLIFLGKELAVKNISEEIVNNLINKLENFHLEILDKKMECSKDKLEKLVKEIFTNFREVVFSYINKKNKKTIPTSKNDYAIDLKNNETLSIIGFGEIISCKIFSGVIDYLSADGICSKSVDLGNLVKPSEIELKNDRELFSFLSTKLADMVEEKIIGGHIPVLSGYIGTFENGIEQTIGRGYTDATAALCTVGLSYKDYDVTMEVQKSVKGILSADPRILDNPKEAKLIKELDYLTAREITGDTGAQAKLLHNQALRSEVQEAGVKIHLFDPFSGKDGSWIKNKRLLPCELGGNQGVVFVGGRKDVMFFSVSSGKMFETGILGRLFTIVGEYFPVDIVSASETEVTFTIDGKKSSNRNRIEEMIEIIKKDLGMIVETDMEFIEYKRDRSLIFLVTHCVKDYTNLLSRATKVLSKNNINIELVSQGRLKRAVVFGTKMKNMKKAVNLLHKEFIL